MRFRPARSLIAAALLLALAPAFAREPTQLVRPASGVVGVEDAQLDPNFWVG